MNHPTTPRFSVQWLPQKGERVLIARGRDTLYTGQYGTVLGNCGLGISKILLDSGKTIKLPASYLDGENRINPKTK